MKKTIRNLLSLVVCAILVIPAFSATVKAPSRTGQNKKHWCWATSAMLVAENNSGACLSHNAEVLDNIDNCHTYAGTDASGKRTAYGAQRQIVISEKGSDKDASGSDTNKRNALSYAAAGSVSTGTWGSYQTKITETGTTMTNIKDELANGNWLIGNMMLSIGGGHSVVLADFNSDTKKFRVIDPWDTTDMWYTYAGVFSANGFPSAGGNGAVEWVQYCN